MGERFTSLISHAVRIIDEFNAAKIFRSQNVGHDCVFIKKLRSSGLKDIDIAIVIEALESTCDHCFDKDGDCGCWNDE